MSPIRGPRLDSSQVPELLSCTKVFSVPPLLATNDLDIFWLAGVPAPVTATLHLEFIYFVRGRGGGVRRLFFFMFH